MKMLVTVLVAIGTMLEAIGIPEKHCIGGTLIGIGILIWIWA